MKKVICIFCVLLSLACDNNSDAIENTIDYRDSMRDFVIGISEKAKATNASFLVIPQNGIELVNDGEDGVTPHIAYLEAIDGDGQEDLLYGYDNDDDATPSATTAYLKSLLNISKAAGKTILVTDYCSTPSHILNSYQANEASGYVSFAAPERNLNVIPHGAPQHENSDVITELNQAKNFLYLINSENYVDKEAFVNAIAATNYDLVIVDLFFNNVALTASDVALLKNKANGGKRLVICYMSIGEAEDYRYYWNDSWQINQPSWIAAENPDWPGNYKVNYWNDEWQGIIYKNDNSYLSRITSAGFDGVYLDIIDAFEYFEE